MSSFASNSSRQLADFATLIGANAETCLATSNVVDVFLAAQVDSDWIREKFGIRFDAKVMRNLKNAVYSLGQGGQRWFSGGGELSERQASVILDYAVLIELLLSSRKDLDRHRDDLMDCREQIQMQISRYTEGQSESVMGLIDAVAERIGR